MTDTHGMHLRLILPLALIVLVVVPAGALAATVDALVLSGSVKVQTDEQMVGYSRDLFRHWTDANSNGCNARHEVLRRQNIVRPRPICTSQTGLWRSVYDTRTVVRARAMDIDHFVPLAEAWRSGANGWDNMTRERFANDLAGPYSLIAVTATSNRAKGDKDPLAWLPPNRSWRCTYVARWVAVKVRWSLTWTVTERNRVNALLAACRPASRKVIVPVKAPITVQPPSEDEGSDDTTGPVTPAPGEDPRFETCSAAVAAGYGPYHRGIDAEYDWYRDGDGDGVVCES